MEIDNDSAAPSITRKLGNIAAIGRESRNITNQPVGIYNRQLEVIAFVVISGMNIITNHYNIEI